MKYKTKDKTTVHIRLSSFLYNGLDVTSAKLNMSISEVVRMAIYEFLKNNYTKKELDCFAYRDDKSTCANSKDGHCTLTNVKLEGLRTDDEFCDGFKLKQKG